MKISEEKSRLLHLAYKTQARRDADHGHLEVAGAEVQRLRSELEAS